MLESCIVVVLICIFLIGKMPFRVFARKKIHLSLVNLLFVYFAYF